MTLALSSLHARRSGLPMTIVLSWRFVSLAVAGSWVHLLVRSSQVVSAKIGWSLSDVLLLPVLEPSLNTETESRYI
jgi:hypothetical protein